MLNGLRTVFGAGFGLRRDIRRLHGHGLGLFANMPVFGGRARSCLRR